MLDKTKMARAIFFESRGKIIWAESRCDPLVHLFSFCTDYDRKRIVAQLLHRIAWSLYQCERVESESQYGRNRKARCNSVHCLTSSTLSHELKELDVNFWSILGIQMWSAAQFAKSDLASIFEPEPGSSWSSAGGRPNNIVRYQSRGMRTLFRKLQVIFCLECFMPLILFFTGDLNEFTLVYMFLVFCWRFCAISSCVHADDLLTAFDST